VGALTFKPLAYRTRPWETRPVWTTNHFEGGEQGLWLHLRGATPIKITASGWLHDRVRFGLDGFRRQRLTQPLFLGGPIGWSTLLSEWWLVSWKRNLIFRVDDMAVHLGWLLWGYQRFNHRGGPTGVVAVDVVHSGVLVFHGGYGLPGATTAVVAIPGFTPYEEDGVLTGPTGPVGWSEWVILVAQVLARPRKGQTCSTGWLANGTPGVNPRGNKAVFQVSPLQRLLSLG